MNFQGFKSDCDDWRRWELWTMAKDRDPASWNLVKDIQGKISYQKNFLKYSSHQIFGHMYGALNINKKKLII